jgi:hypothetical protein
VAKGVVYKLEAVEVEEENGDEVASSGLLLKGLDEAVHESPPARQGRKVVALGRLSDSFLGRTPSGIIEDNGEGQSANGQKNRDELRYVGAFYEGKDHDPEQCLPVDEAKHAHLPDPVVGRN